jgi:hypothetical protein
MENIIPGRRVICIIEYIFIFILFFKYVVGNMIVTSDFPGGEILPCGQRGKTNVPQNKVRF